MTDIHRHTSHLIVHCPTSEGVREVSGASEQVSAAKRASKANSAEQANEGTVERVAQ